MLAPALFLAGWLLSLVVVSVTPGRTPDLFGFAVASVGDLDGDGVPELAIADPDTGGPWRGWFQRRGTVWVVSGAGGAVVHRLMADEPGDPFATALLGPGDTTGDGIPDLVAAGPVGVHVIDGATGEVVYTVEITRQGKNALYLLATWPTLCALGDLDGDCCADFALGSPYDESRGLDAGLVLIVSGRTGTILRELAGAPGEHLGMALANAGDLDRDGRADLAVTSYLDSTGPPRPKAVRVWSDVGARIAFEADDPGTDHGYYGFALASAGDADGDGMPDLAISGYNRVRVVASSDGREVWERRGDYRMFGMRLASIVAEPADDSVKLLIGSPRSISDGSAILVDARTGDVLQRAPGWIASVDDYDVFELRDPAGFFAPPDLGVGAGECVAAAGDVDGDGLVDYAVGAARPTAGALGCVAVFSSRTGERLRFYQRWELLRR